MLTYGFFNSLNNDRKYNAEQMAYIIDALVNDGVMQNYGEYLAVKPGDGMSVVVEKGMAWFDSTWTRNDGQIVLDIDPADVTLARYDAVVLEVDRSVAVRANSIKVVKGVASSAPAKPTMVKSSNINQYPLAYIKVEPGVTSISSSAIEIRVGQSDCPWITGILQTVPIDTLFAKWDGDFSTWFENLQAMLDDNVVSNLQAQIDDLTADMKTKATKAEASEAAKTIGMVNTTDLVELVFTRYMTLANITNNYSTVSYTYNDRFFIISYIYSGTVRLLIYDGVAKKSFAEINTSISASSASVSFIKNGGNYFYIVDDSNYRYFYRISNISTGAIARVGNSRIAYVFYVLSTYLVAINSSSIYYVNKTSTSSFSLVYMPDSITSHTNKCVIGTSGNDIIYGLVSYNNNQALFTFAKVSIPSGSYSVLNTYSVSEASGNHNHLCFPLFSDSTYFYVQIVVSNSIYRILKINKSSGEISASINIPQALCSPSTSYPVELRYLYSDSTNYYFLAYYEYSSSQVVNNLIIVKKTLQSYTSEQSFFNSGIKSYAASVFNGSDERLIDKDIIAISNTNLVFSISKRKLYSIGIAQSSYLTMDTMPSPFSMTIMNFGDTFGGVYLYNNGSTTLLMVQLDVPKNLYVFSHAFKVVEGDLYNND